MMMGPFSAAYAGNSMGAVMEITTRLPEKLEGSINQTQALQTFSLYGTDKTYGTTQTTVDVGDRFGKFAFWASGNYQNSHSQPLSYVTERVVPDRHDRRLRRPQQARRHRPNVLGATGLLHTEMANAKIKAAYDLTPTIRAAYTFGYWKNDADAERRSVHHGVGPADICGPGRLRERVLQPASGSPRAEPVDPQRHAGRTGTSRSSARSTASTPTSSARRRRRRRPGRPSPRQVA